MIIVACTFTAIKYANEETFISDVQKMFENARKFNVEGSQVYIDANRLEKTLKKCRRLLPPLDKELTNDPTGASLWERAVTGSLNPFAAGGHEALLRERRIARRALGAGGQGMFRTELVYNSNDFTLQVKAVLYCIM